MDIEAALLGCSRDRLETGPLRLFCLCLRSGRAGHELKGFRHLERLNRALGGQRSSAWTRMHLLRVLDTPFQLFMVVLWLEGGKRAERELLGATRTKASECGEQELARRWACIVFEPHPIWQSASVLILQKSSSADHVAFVHLCQAPLQPGLVHAAFLLHARSPSLASR